MYEIKDCKPCDGDLRFQCYADDYFDLFIWRRENTIVQFQLVYDKQRDMHAITWHDEKGFLHSRVDVGEAGEFPVSPILISDGLFNKKKLISRFQKESNGIDQRARIFIIEKLNIFKK